MALAVKATIHTALQLYILYSMSVREGRSRIIINSQKQFTYWPFALPKKGCPAQRTTARKYPLSASVPPLRLQYCDYPAQIFLGTALRLKGRIIGTIPTIQIFSEYAKWHQHIHIIVANGLFRGSGIFTIGSGKVNRQVVRRKLNLLPDNLQQGDCQIKFCSNRC